MIDTSPLNTIQTLLLPARFHQNCKPFLAAVSIIGLSPSMETTLPVMDRLGNGQTLTLKMLRLFPSKSHFFKLSKPGHVGTHWIALAEYSQMSTHVPGLRLFFRYCVSFHINKIICSHFSGFLHYFVLAKLTTSSIRVKVCHDSQ